MVSATCLRYATRPELSLFDASLLPKHDAVNPDTAPRALFLETKAFLHLLVTALSPWRNFHADELLQFCLEGGCCFLPQSAI